MADLFKPDLVVMIKNLKKPYDVINRFRQANALKYAYAFKCRDKIIKIGMSEDNSKIYGERAYRQIANLPGWHKMPVSSCGKDILSAVHFFEEKEKVTVHKDDCSLEIWLSFNKASVTEDDLLNQYEKLHGCLPPGNPKDTRSKIVVHHEIFSNLFERA